MRACVCCYLMKFCFIETHDSAVRYYGFTMLFRIKCLFVYLFTHLFIYLFIHLYYSFIHFNMLLSYIIAQRKEDFKK